MPSKVLCPCCEKLRLEPMEGEEGIKGYMCPSASRFPEGSECNVLVSIDDYQDWEEEIQLKERAAIQSALAASTEAEGEDEAGEEASNGNEEVLSQKQVKSTVKSLVSGTLAVRRQPAMGLVTLKGADSQAYRRPYKPPRRADGSEMVIPTAEERLNTGFAKKTLGVRRKFYRGFAFGEDNFKCRALEPLILPPIPPPPEPVKPPEVVVPPVLKQQVSEPPPPDILPLVIWEPTPEEKAQSAVPLSKIEVDPMLTKWLRPHQREGVQFMCECLLKQRQFDGSGVILADDMGLGKTLQSITVLYTLLTQGFEVGVPTVRRALILCPSSLVMNWAGEISKWVKDRIKPIALTESGKEYIMRGITDYLSPSLAHPVMILSYETFRKYPQRFYEAGACDLLICDEAHRLKNDKTISYQLLFKLECKRRVLLSGTPMQNDLKEFYAMVNFTNPDVLGNAREFAKVYEKPILVGREPDATDAETALGDQRAQELSVIVNQFILRRSNALLSQHLPPKVIQVVCCKMTELQLKLYNHITKSKEVRVLLANGQKSMQVLPLITALKALCNHPKLVFDARNTSKSACFKGVETLFPPEFFNNPFGGPCNPAFSGKMHTLDRLLCSIRKTSLDRVVLVSNYTQTLDLFKDICLLRGWGFVRLDGSTSVKKRQDLVDRLSDQTNDVFVFLLSSKAGGCGLNLVGANRLVLFDPDWNPATDKQAAARVWRDGQTKRCFIYRFLSTGTIEEKVYQRQLSKEGLADVMGGSAQANQLSTEELRDLFRPMEHTRADTHDSYDCPCIKGINPAEVTDSERDEGTLLATDQPEEAMVCRRLQGGYPKEEDLLHWSHHVSLLTIPDPAFRKAHYSHVPEFGHFATPAAPTGHGRARPMVSVISASTTGAGPQSGSGSAGAGAGAGPGKGPGGGGGLGGMKRYRPKQIGSDLGGKKPFSAPGSSLPSAPAPSPLTTPTTTDLGTAPATDGGSFNPDAKGIDMVTFAFCCEVQGRQITGPQEEEAAALSCMGPPEFWPKAKAKPLIPVDLETALKNRKALEKKKRGKKGDESTSEDDDGFIDDGNDSPGEGGEGGGDGEGGEDQGEGGGAKQRKRSPKRKRSPAAKKKPPPRNKRKKDQDEGDNDGEEEEEQESSDDAVNEGDGDVVVEGQSEGSAVGVGDGDVVEVVAGAKTGDSGASVNNGDVIMVVDDDVQAVGDTNAVTNLTGKPPSELAGAETGATGKRAGGKLSLKKPTKPNAPAADAPKADKKMARILNSLQVDMRPDVVTPEPVVSVSGRAVRKNRGEIARFTDELDRSPRISPPTPSRESPSFAAVAAAAASAAAMAATTAAPSSLAALAPPPSGEVAAAVKAMEEAESLKIAAELQAMFDAEDDDEGPRRGRPKGRGKRAPGRRISDEG